MTTPKPPPYDQAICSVLVRPLVHTPVTPNHITTVSLLMALAAAALFAWGEGSAPLWAAGLVVIARFIDHMDGELARQAGKSSPFGAMYDSMTGTASYGLLFVGLGYGEWRHGGPDWALWLSALVFVMIAVNMIVQFRVEMRTGSTPSPYPQVGRFEVEDGIYLILPIIWLTGTRWFFLVGTVGTLIFTAFSIRSLLRDLRRVPA